MSQFTLQEKGAFEEVSRLLEGATIVECKIARDVDNANRAGIKLVLDNGIRCGFIVRSLNTFIVTAEEKVPLTQFVSAGGNEPPPIAGFGED